MATSISKLMTADEFYDFVHRPENDERTFELKRGRVIEVLDPPRPGRRHGVVCSLCGFILGDFARRRKKGYVCGGNVGVVIEQDPDTVGGTDVQFYEDATTIEEVGWKYSRTPPRLAVEVVAPGDTAAKVLSTVCEMFTAGTPLVWVVNSEAEYVTVYRPRKEPYVVEKDQELTGEDVLPGFRCQVAELFTLPSGQSLSRGNMK